MKSKSGIDHQSQVLRPGRPDWPRCSLPTFFNDLSLIFTGWLPGCPGLSSCPQNSISLATDCLILIIKV
jgi:hypothetical protein